MFQSPQWGSNSKGKDEKSVAIGPCFSPRNGEVILKYECVLWVIHTDRFSPRNGEVILKSLNSLYNAVNPRRFSPRNGEVILKATP